MFIYNITMKVSWEIHDEWLMWLKNYHIPAILDYNCFSESRLLKLEEIDENDGPTYAVQFTALSKDDYNRYIALHANEIFTVEQKFWGMKLFTFSTLMEILPLE